MTDYSQIEAIPALNVTRKLPANIVPSDIPLFAGDLNKKLDPVPVYRFRNINVTPAGILFNGLNVFRPLLIWPSHAAEFNAAYLLRNYIRRRRKTIGGDKTAVICFDYWSSGYFHWMCDFLPRLLLVESELKDAVLLLPEHLSAPYMESSLKAFGPLTIQRFSAKTYVRCARAIVPGFVARSGDNNPNILLKLRDRLTGFFKPETKPERYSENIYISRSRALGRYILNENEVINSLSEFGFKTIYFEEHSFSEQIAICYNARRLIGLHGANLTNIIFMREGANVLELRNKDDASNNYYFSLASSLHLNYYYLKCEPHNIRNTQTFDLVVDLNELKKTMTSFLNNN